MSPIHPIWNRSSTFSLDCEKRLITLNTSLRLSLIYSSRACISPCSIFSKRACFSSFFKTSKAPLASTYFIGLSSGIVILLYLAPSLSLIVPFNFSYSSLNLIASAVGVGLFSSFSLAILACLFLLSL